MAIASPIEIKQGTTFIIELTVTKAGLAEVLTGYTILSQIRRAALAEDKVVEFTVGTTLLATGVFTLYLTPAQTSALTCGDSKDDPASKYVWDCKMTSPDATPVVTRLVDASTIIVSAQVSR